MTVPFEVLIDHDNSGTFAGSNDPVTDRLMGSFFCTRGKDLARRFAPAMTGEFNAPLFNLDKLFSPGNTLSPIYPNARPGRAVLWRWITSGSGGLQLQDDTDLILQDDTGLQLQSTGSLNVFRGVLQDYRHHPDAEHGLENVRVDMPTLGTLSRLVGKKVTTEVFQNITTDVAIGHALDAAGWPVAERILDVGLAVLPWFWLDDNEDVFQAIGRIVLSEGPGASFFANGDGYFVFQNRDYRTTDSHSTMSQDLFVDTDVRVQRLLYDDGFRDTIQGCALTVVERSAQALAPIWSLGSDLVLGSNEVRKLKIRASEPFINVTIPSLVGTNAVQTLTPSTALTSGTFILVFNNEQTTAIARNASAATIQAALEALTNIGAGNVLCGGGPINTAAVMVTFRGTLKEQAVSLLTVISSLNTGTAAATVNVDVTQFAGGQNQINTLYASAPLSSGVFQIKSVNGNESNNIQWNASAANIQTALENTVLVGVGQVTCAGGPIDTDDVTVEWTGTLADTTVPVSVVDSTLVSSTAATATITVSETVQGSGPDYVLTAGGIAFTYDRTSGTVVTLTATAGASGGTATGLQVRAQSVTVVRTHEVSYPEDLSTIIQDGGQIYRPDIRQELSLTDAQPYALDVFNFYQNPRPVVVVGTETSVYDAANITLFGLDVSYRVTVSNTQLGINQDYHINSMRYTVEGLRLHCDFGCELAI